MDDNITLGEYLTDVMENIDVVLARINANQDDGQQFTYNEDLTDELEAASLAIENALSRVGAISKLIDG